MKWLYGVTLFASENIEGKKQRPEKMLSDCNWTKLVEVHGTVYLLGICVSHSHIFKLCQGEGERGGEGVGVECKEHFRRKLSKARRS